MKYDIGLMRVLNNEYESKKVVASFTEYTDEYQLKQANYRIDTLSNQIDFEGKHILEIGCGGGYVSHQLAKRYDCTVVGIDIYMPPPHNMDAVESPKFAIFDS